MSISCVCNAYIHSDNGLYKIIEHVVNTLDVYQSNAELSSIRNAGVNGNYSILDWLKSITSKYSVMLIYLLIQCRSILLG